MIKTAEEEMQEITARWKELDDYSRTMFSNPHSASINMLRHLKYINALVAIGYVSDEIKMELYEKERRLQEWKSRSLSVDHTEFQRAVEMEQHKPAIIEYLCRGELPKSLYDEIILVQNENVRNRYLAERNKWIAFQAYEYVPEEMARTLRTDSVPWSDYKLLPPGIGIQPPEGYERSGIDSYYAADVFWDGRRNHKKFHACHGLNGGCICFHCKNDRPECCTKHMSEHGGWYAQSKSCRDCSCPDFIPEEPNRREYGMRIYTICCAKPEVAQVHDWTVELRIKNWMVTRRVISYGFWDDAKWEAVLGRKPNHSKTIDRALVAEYFAAHPFECTDAWRGRLRYQGNPQAIVCERDPESELRKVRILKKKYADSYPWNDDAYELQGWLEKCSDNDSYLFWFAIPEEGILSDRTDEEIRKLDVIW